MRRLDLFAERTPSPPPSRVHHQVVRVRHPGYDDAGNTLFAFPAVDVYCEGQQRQEPGVEEVGGVLVQVVYTACTIVSGNKDGFLSRDKSGTDIVWEPQMSSAAPAEIDQVLRAGDYYFHVPSPPPITVASPSTASLRAAVSPDFRIAYAVCPTFREWQPPPQIPESFQASVIDDPQPPKTRRCHVTAETDANECAHLVPAGEMDWFGTHAMWLRHYTTSRFCKDAIHQHGNIIPLRKDIHFLFDSSHFTVFPRLDKNGAYQPAVHVLTTDAPSLYKKYHARCLRPLRGISAHFLFARFAWSIFPLLRGFFQAGMARSVLVAGNIEQTRVGSECEQLVQGQGPGRSGLSPKRKSTSPTKSRSPEKRVCTEYARESNSPDSAVAGLGQAKEKGKRRRSSCSISTGSNSEEEDDQDTSSEEITNPDELQVLAAQGLRAQKKPRTSREMDNARFLAAQGRPHYGFVESEWDEDDGWEERNRGRTRDRFGRPFV
ncbi:HNH endonuclease [Teratosphaeria destructans]|uniref:HNH endonuclease n=1 Tax=Teratosphaeria destructans TaxID=418781 RepID=A0A9W7STE3_9PEZI|nr:HNH endonuclease [Teratosphaeria destructans]